MKMTKQAAEALRAVEIFKKCGRYAAWQYAKNRNIVRLYILARQLEAAK
jgi:hypothetical protein